MEYQAKQAVYLPVSDFLKLEFHLMDTRPGTSVSSFVTELVNRWLAAEMERLAPLKNGPALHGFQWKSVFLPEGTDLRTSYRKTIEFAKVIGDHLVSEDGSALTPSLLANRHTIGRNAWHAIWLRFPGESRWILADECRARSPKHAKNEIDGPKKP